MKIGSSMKTDQVLKKQCGDKLMTVIPHNFFNEFCVKGKLMWAKLKKVKNILQYRLNDNVYSVKRTL